VDDGRNEGIAALAATYGTGLRMTGGAKGAGRARNIGAAGFSGGQIVFLDADVVPAPGSLATLIGPIQAGVADATVGCYGRDVSGRNFAGAYKQLYLAHTYGNACGFLRNQFWTAFGAVRAEVFFDLGGFRECFSGAGPEDIELGIRLTSAGRSILSVPSAAANHLAQLTLGALALNDLRKGAEDTYIHWTTRTRLSDNRHARPAAMLAVGCAGICLSLVPFTTAALLPAAGWVAFRWDLLRDLARQINIASVLPVTFALDAIRGLAVVLGTFAAGRTKATRGRYRPFQTNSE
jgi:hypothetical protein